MKALILKAFNSGIAWALAINFCIDETVAALAFDPIEGVVIGIACFGKLALVAHELNAPKHVIQEIVHIQHELQLLQLQQGGPMAACTTTHKISSTVQGPGVCCAALGASGLTPAVGVRIAAVNSAGKCIVCEIKSSTSAKHPGALVFKRGKSHVVGSAVSCPSSSGGCCALVGA